MRLLISAERHNRRRAFTTLLLELLPGASDFYFLCLAFSRSTTAFPLFCFCSTGICWLLHLLFRGSLDFLYLLSLRLRFRSGIVVVGCSDWSGCAGSADAGSITRAGASRTEVEPALR